MNILIKELAVNLEPFDVYTVFSAEKDIILLDSSMRNALGRYSFLGLNPFAVLKGRADGCVLNGKNAGPMFLKCSENFSAVSCAKRHGAPVRRRLYGIFFLRPGP
jgi:hypothetical protein